MKYALNERIQSSKNKVKMAIAAGVAGVSILGFAAIPAFASSAGDGSDYCTQNGCTQALSHTQCAGAGAFDALGKNASLGAKKVHATFLGSYPGPGTDGQQTAYNNSHLCGNPQN